MIAQLFLPEEEKRTEESTGDRKKESGRIRQPRKGELMKKVCRLDGLDCASCAAKIENAVAKIPGVSSASVNFMTTKMTIEGDDARMDEIMEQAAAIAKKVEPDVVVRKA